MTTDALLNISDALSQINFGGMTMESAARKVVRNLYESLKDSEGGRVCVLARLYKTHTYSHLPSPLKAYVDGMVGENAHTDEMKCLTLLATAGEEPAWNERYQSVGHQSIPLIDTEAIKNIPMVARLVEEFGIDTQAILTPNPKLILDLEQKKYQVFHVPDAMGSPYIPAQKDFVLPYGIQSVVGFGGMLPSGDLFAVILFSRAKIERALAEDFSLLVLPVKIALLPYVFGEVFDLATV